MSRLPVIPKKQFDHKSKFVPKGKITLTPFTVGLENLLLQVKDAEDEREKMDAVKQVIQTCLTTSDIQVSSLPLFVIEEIFLRLRQHSVGELIDQRYECSNDVPIKDKEGNDSEETKTCGTVMPIQIDLRDFTILEQSGHTNTIVISDPIGIKFKYPSISMFEDADTSTENEVETIISCIDSIFDADNVFPASDHTREQLTEFWNQLTLMQKKEVFDKFFMSMPRLNYKKVFKCPGCGHDHTIQFTSLKEVFQ